MRQICAAIITAALVPAALDAGELQEPRAMGYKWRAELGGPAKRCRVPESILFVVGDAIIEGKIIFQRRTYYPRGRLEDNLDTGFSLVRRSDDPKPLVTVTAKAGGGWNGKWTSPGNACTGAARIVPR
jgi:hypothetical protein